MNNQETVELSIEEQVMLANYRQKCDEILELQIELNKMAQERDHYKSELEKMVDEKSKPKEPTKK